MKKGALWVDSVLRGVFQIVFDPYGEPNLVLFNFA